MERDENCTLCKLGAKARAGDVCIPAQPFTHKADLLFVVRSPLSSRARAELDEYLTEAGIDPKRVTVTAVNRCKVWDVDPGKTDMKTCASTFLLPEIAELRPNLIVAVGNEALYALTGRSGIMKYRAQRYEVQGIPCIPTISMGMVKRNPGQRAGFLADLRFIMRAADGSAAPVGPPARIRYVTSVAGLKELREALAGCAGAYFDIESNGFDEFRPDSRMVTLSFTTWGENAQAPEECWVVPLYHPESPFRKIWKLVLVKLAGLLDGKKVVAHNGKFDCRWMAEFKCPLTLTFDTLLAAHILDENRPKGLKPLAQSLLGVAPWAIETRDLLNTPLKKIVKYNGLDTWYGAHLYFYLRKQLIQQPRLARLMTRLMVPASNALVGVERAAIWADREKLFTNLEIAKRQLADVERDLLKYVPPKESWPPRIKEVNFNRSNFATWWLFDHLEFPVLARGKAKENGDLGDPSMAESVMTRLRAEFPDHPVPELLIRRSGIYKNLTAFLEPYSEQIDENDRIHSTFKLHGTVTGRLSSGKNDEEKVTSRVQNRGVNLQQVPRDSFIRGIFGAPPGWVFVECDYSQVELRVAAFLAREDTMLSLYRNGQDIHTTMAQRMTGRVDVTKEERKKAKAVNFGFLYGMGWKKFIETAWNNYGVVVTEEEARAFRIAFFETFPKLLPWHSRQRRLVSKYKRVESPLGRIRHLPDIDSPDEGVRAEAQRQSINSPVQSFASDMALLSLVILDQEFKKRGLRAHPVGTVHDAINFEVPEDEAPVVVPLIRQVMENLPLHSFGVDLDVPIVADVKIGRHWGGSLEVEDAISSSTERMKEWMMEYKEAA